MTSVDLDDPDWDNKCEITILDDDPNIRKVEVTSEPARESNTYGVGEVIEISATFSNRVEVAEGGNPRLGLRVGDDWKQAQYLRGSDSRVLVFGYTVKADDEDTDGIRMPGGYQDSEDRWHNFPGYDAITHHSSDRVVYRAYKGFDDDADHKVDGSLAPLATNVEITSSPETAIPTALGRRRGIHHIQHNPGRGRQPLYQPVVWTRWRYRLEGRDLQPGFGHQHAWCLHTTSGHATWIPMA